jgi:hypothetical protein
MTTAALVNAEMSNWVRQLVLPGVAEFGVKGSIGKLSRETGVSFSRLRKAFYRWEAGVPTVLEYRAVQDAYARWVERQENDLIARLDEIRRLREQRREEARQLEIAV